MKLHYGWMIVAVGALMSCVGMGAMFSLAVFLQPIAFDTGWTRAEISSAMTLDFITMGVAAFGWGALSDRYGTRIVVLTGTVLMGFGLVLASRATTLLQFQLSYGVLLGIAAGAIYAPMVALTTAWFDTHRSLAVALVSAGMGVAPMTVSPFARWLITAYDWRTAQLVIGIAAWVLLVPAALLVRRPPAAAPTAAGAIAGSTTEMSAGAALRSPQFIVLAATFFTCCAAHSGPIFHTVSYAMFCGIPPLSAVTIYSVEGLAGLGGRLLFGILADRLGVKPVLIGGLVLQAFAGGSYFFTSQLGEFYAVAVVFGLTYGGVMPLYATLARQYFSMRIMGTIFGAAAMVSSLGMALGPLVGGWIFDTYGSYGGLYIGTFALGLGAAAIALAFPPAPVPAAARLQPA
jgi:MFS family permease